MTVSFVNFIISLLSQKSNIKYYAKKNHINATIKKFN